MRKYIQTEDIPEHFLEGSGARYKTDGLPVVEYELEDIPKLISGELPWIFGLVQTSPKSEGGGSTWFTFTPEAEKVWQENKAAKEATYWRKVDAQLEAEKQFFKRKQHESPDPTETLKREIDFVRWQLYPNDNKDTPARLGCNPQAHFGQSAARLLRGERTFDNINLHYHQIQAEVAFKYLAWLRELQAKGSEQEAENQTDTKDAAPLGLTNQQAAYYLAVTETPFNDGRAKSERTKQMTYRLTGSEATTAPEKLHSYWRKARDAKGIEKALNEAIADYKAGKTKGLSKMKTDLEAIEGHLNDEQKKVVNQLIHNARQYIED